MGLINWITMAYAYDVNKMKDILKGESRDKTKMEVLSENYPDMFEPCVVEALSALVNKSKLGIVEIITMAPIFECNLIKSYLNLPTNDPNRETAKSSIELYLEAVAKFHSAEHPRAFVTTFMQLSEISVKLSPSLNYFSKAHAGVVTLPKIVEKNTVIVSDIQQKVQGNLLQFSDKLRNAPVDIFNFAMGKRRVVFDGGVIESLIKSQIVLQNQMNAANWNNHIVTNNFLPITSILDGDTSSKC